MDVPPSWSGADPDGQLEAYFKAAEAWRRTTRVPAKQQAVQLLAVATGDLRSIMTELEIEVITNDDGAQVLLEHVRHQYQWTVTRSLPTKLENTLFVRSSQRQRQESLLAYCAKKIHLMKDLDKAGCTLPENAKGIILLRDAALS
eukprot:748871-Amphidinium_carterae.1